MTILSELKTVRSATKVKLESMVTMLRTTLTGEGVVDPTTLARKVAQVEQFWTAFDADHGAYLAKLNPTEEQLGPEMEFWTTVFTAKDEVLAQAQTQLDIANVPVPDGPPPPPDNTASIRNLNL